MLCFVLQWSSRSDCWQKKGGERGLQEVRQFSEQIVGTITLREYITMVLKYMLQYWTVYQFFQCLPGMILSKSLLSYR